MVCLPSRNTFRHEWYLATTSQQFDEQAVGILLWADTEA